jgi:hypothetical protein
MMDYSCCIAPNATSSSSRPPVDPNRSITNVVRRCGALVKRKLSNYERVIPSSLPIASIFSMTVPMTLSCAYLIATITKTIQQS